MSTRELTGPRLSSAVRCPRMAVYEATDAPRAPLTQAQEELFRRGRVIGDAAARDIVAGFREQGRRPVAELEIPWPAKDPIGVGHADIYIPHERHVIEVVSTKDGALPPHKALQAVAYTHHHPKATTASVLSIDPATGEDSVYPIDVAALTPEVERITDEVVAGVRDGVIPERVCRHQGDSWAGAGMCQFAAWCFKGWERPEPNLLPGFADDLRKLADLDDLISRTKDLGTLESERDEIRARIRGALTPGEEYVEGGIRVKVNAIAGRKTFSFAKFEAAGHKVPDVLTPFVSESGGHERWTIRRMEP